MLECRHHHDDDTSQCPGSVVYILLVMLFHHKWTSLQQWVSCWLPSPSAYKTTDLRLQGITVFQERLEIWWIIYSTSVRIFNRKGHKWRGWALRHCIVKKKNIWLFTESLDWIWDLLQYTHLLLVREEIQSENIHMKYVRLSQSQTISISLDALEK